jgi:hypothetical protein
VSNLSFYWTSARWLTFTIKPPSKSVLNCKIQPISRELVQYQLYIHILHVKRIQVVNIIRVLLYKHVHNIISHNDAAIAHILLVIWILDRVHGLIFPVKVYILPSRQTVILNFDLVLKKTLTWAISFELYVLELWYLRYRCIMKRPFFWYQDFWPCDFDLELWLSFKKL